MFDMSKITCVYSGRKGCACGCRGNYAYASAHRNERPKHYEGDQDISDRSVKLIARRVESLLHDHPEQIEQVILEDDYLAVDMEHDRTYTIYFAEEN